MKIYFMGICGTAMGNAALLMRECGHEVVGADTGVYPPMSTMLQEAGVDILEGYSAQRLEELAPDLVVVGNANSRGHPEIEWLLNERKIPYTSVPELLSRFILSKRQNIVISGTHGKTTTTAMTAFLLSAAGRKPGWLVGGVPRDLPGGSELGASEAPFVIEGDEYDSAFFDKRSKFIHYQPRILVINNIEMDHADIFRDLDDVLRTFRHVTRIVPGNGWVLFNGDDANARRLMPLPWTHTLSVGTGEACDLRIVDFEENAEGSRFKLLCNGTELPARLKVGGLFNARNAAMAAVADMLSAGGNPSDTAELSRALAALGNYQGVQRRQELLVDTPPVMAVEDFGHHPTAIANTLQSLRARHPERKLVAVFEPRSNTAATNLFQKEFAKALSLADSVFLGKVHRAERMAPERRLNTFAIAEELRENGREATAYTDNGSLLEDLIAHCKTASETPRLVCFFSNGSFDGIIRQFRAHASNGPV